MSGANPDRLRVAVYNLYWDTFGGGEQVAGSIAEVLAERHEVDVLGPRQVPIDALRARLGVDIARCRWRQVSDDAEASAASADYDLFVNTTYLSSAVNRAPHGLYYGHFPGLAPTKTDQIKAKISQRIVNAIDAGPIQPRKVVSVRGRLAPLIRSTDFVSSYDLVVGNSLFTNGWIERLWGVEVEVLYPPVRPMPGNSVKDPVIVSVGRFFDPSKGHSKKQAELVRAFRELHQSGRAPGWELHLVGGCDHANRESLNEVRKLALGLPVHIHLNAPGSVLVDIVARAAIYWHGGGFGEDPEVHPERFEHFGIAVVEAMSAGAVPVVFGAAGPAEIVRDGIDGYHWKSRQELVARTYELIVAPERVSALSANAAARAVEFSKEAFGRRLNELVDGRLS